MVMRIGMIGLDTSHTEAFASILNKADGENTLSGARITHGYPGGSPDFSMSISRVEKFTGILAEKFGVTIVDSPEAVAEHCDAIMITSVDGRIHPEQFGQIAPWGKPVFIDKPLATTSEAARHIADLSRKHEAPVFSASAIRFSEPLLRALKDSSKGKITGADFCGPLPVETTQGHFFWYGIHTADSLFSAMGPGCADVEVIPAENTDLVVGRWRDGRIGVIRGFRENGGCFSANIHREEGLQMLNLMDGSKPQYFFLLERIIRFFQSGKSPVDIEESIEVIRFLECADHGRKTGEAIPL